MWYHCLRHNMILLEYLNTFITYLNGLASVKTGGEEDNPYSPETQFQFHYNKAFTTSGKAVC